MYLINGKGPLHSGPFFFNELITNLDVYMFQTFFIALYIVL